MINKLIEFLDSKDFQIKLEAFTLFSLIICHSSPSDFLTILERDNTILLKVMQGATMFNSFHLKKCLLDAIETMCTWDKQESMIDSVSFTNIIEINKGCDFLEDCLKVGNIELAE